MVDMLQFIFSHFPDVQTTLDLAGHELISYGYAMVRELLLLRALFSRRVECRRCSLAVVIPISMEVLQECPLLSDMFGDVEEVPECLHAIIAHLLARLVRGHFV
jgi:hypothetical protein